MLDAKKFKESQLPKQKEAIFAAIAVAEGTPNPVIEVPFFLYPEVEEELKKANWTVLGTCRSMHEGKVRMYTHLCPVDVNKTLVAADEPDARSGADYFSEARDL